jgi:restriction endonuclease-like protein
LPGRTPAHIEGRGIPGSEPGDGGMQADGRERRTLLTSQTVPERLPLLHGSYTRQRGRQERCSLTEIGVRYWPLVPRLFRIDGGIDHSVCPLHRNYQLVRNLLAACLSQSGKILAGARVVLLHDERNPAFRPGGDGWRAYQQVRSMLIEPRMLQRTSWQRLVRLLCSEERTTWLADALDAKYGSFESASGIGGGH